MDKEHKEVSVKLIKITLMSLLFMTIELIGGYLANSIAIFADAFHLLSDVLAYLISLGAVWLSTRPSSPSYLTFGWEKAEPLGALINIAVIYLVTGELFVQATKRLINKEIVDQPKYMLITSVFGLICNIIIMGILHNDPHGGHQGCSHGHGHAHSHEEEHSHCQHGHAHSHEEEHSHGHGHSHCHEQQHSHTHETCSHQHMALSDCSKQADNSHTHSASCSHSKPKHCSQSHPHDHDHPQESNKECCSHEERNSGDQLTPKQFLMDDHLAEPQLGEAITSDQHLHEQADPPKKIKNINLEAAYIHILTDIILSIGVIVSALIIYFLSPDHHTWSPWQYADPLCTYLFSFLAFYSTWPILKEAVLLLLDSSHQQSLPANLALDIAKLSSVKELLDLKVWSTNRKKHYAAVKVRLHEGHGAMDVKSLLQRRGLTSYVQVQGEERGK